ncbi:hypothetical protein [Halobaculum marinum]|uniref:hypothetical protein n=1 Tax=Halobaculum marinum TaxID=3031996 RepID=UPI0023E3DE4D|nr:hypothetical protein [Halobaculum sp. DT55]
MGEYPVGASHTTARVVDALLEVDDAGVSELARELGSKELSTITCRRWSDSASSARVTVAIGSDWHCLTPA